MNNLRKIRRALDLTQDQLAKEVGTNKSYICELEKGRITPSLYRAYDISSALGESIVDVFPPVAT